jgi:hypothetical protein
VATSALADATFVRLILESQLILIEMNRAEWLNQ